MVDHLISSATANLPIQKFYVSGPISTIYVEKVAALHLCLVETFCRVESGLPRECAFLSQPALRFHFHPIFNQCVFVLSTYVDKCSKYAGLHSWASVWATIISSIWADPGPY